VIPDRTAALQELADRYFATPSARAKLTVAAQPAEDSPRAPSRHDALVKYGVASREHGLSGAALLAALSVKNGTYEEPKPDDEVRSIARWCDREIESKAGTPLQAVDAAELLSRPYKEPSFLVDHLVPENALVLLSGDTGSAKTALALHLCVSVACGLPVAGRFPARPDAVALYVNGEMSADTLTRYLHEAAAGLRVTIPPKRLIFEGADGIASWRFGENPAALAALVGELRPSLVVLDTQRALLVDDESDTAEVRRVFGWLRTNIVDAFGASVLVAHHLRKIGPISNSSRERVAGSRDIIASVDVHLAAKARDGGPMHAIKMDKTRAPHEGVCAGTEWPVEARLEPGAPKRSIFVAGEPESAATASDVSAEGKAVDEIRARLEAEGSLTADDVKATSGAPKRAWDRLRKSGEIVQAGKCGRKVRYALQTSLPQAEGLF